MGDACGHRRMLLLHAALGDRRKYKYDARCTVSDSSVIGFRFGEHPVVQFGFNKYRRVSIRRYRGGFCGSNVKDAKPVACERLQ